MNLDNKIILYKQEGKKYSMLLNYSNLEKFEIGFYHILEIWILIKNNSSIYNQSYIFLRKKSKKLYSKFLNYSNLENVKLNFIKYLNIWILISK